MMVCWKRVADKLGMSEALKEQEKDMTHEEANQLIADRMVDVEKEVGHEPTAIEKKLKSKDKNGKPYWKRIVEEALNDYKLYKSITIQKLRENSLSSKETVLNELDLKITALADDYEKLEKEIKQTKKKKKKKK